MKLSIKNLALAMVSLLLFSACGEKQEDKGGGHEFQVPVTD